jgi:Endonuclease NucS C-terminal domain
VILSGSRENGAYREDQLGGTLMQAQNGAQRAVFDTGPEATSYASELLDRDTCKRCKEADGVEQLSRYLDLMRRDTLLGTVHGIFAAQLIKPQARVLATDRGISCVTVDYDGTSQLSVVSR